MGDAVQASVYVIAAENGPVKVGIALDPEKRLKSLRTGTPYRIHLAHVEDTEEIAARKIEKAAHSLLAAARVQGEWFSVTVDDARAAIHQALRQLRETPEPPPRVSEAIPVGVNPNITPAQIRAARALLGWSQTDLADASGVAVITIKNIERGATDPKSGTVAKLEQAFEKAGVLLQEPGDHRAKGQSVGFAEREGPKRKP